MGLAPSQNMAAASQQLSQSIQKDLTSVVAYARTAPSSFKDPVASGVVNAVQRFNADENTLKDAFSQAIGGLKRAAKDASMDYQSENVLGGILSSLKSVFENARDTGEGLSNNNADKQNPLSLRSTAAFAALPYLQFNGCQATLPSKAGGMAASVMTSQLVNTAIKAGIKAATKPETQQQKDEQEAQEAKKERDAEIAKTEAEKRTRKFEREIAERHKPPKTIKSHFA